jgi:hypothetical protein
VAGLPLPAWPDGRIRLAVDVSNWLRPDAATSPGRMFCHGAGEAGVTVLWQAWHRRFDLEHTFRFIKSQLGWARPLLRDPAAAGRRTWLLLACYARLYLARPLAAAVRLPWQRPQPPGTMTPGRVRAGFRHARETAGSPASPAKPGKPGPGRPTGSKNTRKAPRHHVGKHNPKPASRHVKAAKKAKQTG